MSSTGNFIIMLVAALEYEPFDHWFDSSSAIIFLTFSYPYFSLFSLRNNNNIQPQSLNVTLFKNKGAQAICCNMRYFISEYRRFSSPILAYFSMSFFFCVARDKIIISHYFQFSDAVKGISCQLCRCYYHRIRKRKKLIGAFTLCLLAFGFVKNLSQNTMLGPQITSTVCLAFTFSKATAKSHSVDAPLQVVIVHTPVCWNVYLEPKWGGLRKTWYLVPNSVFVLIKQGHRSPDEAFGPHSTVRRQPLCKTINAWWPILPATTLSTIEEVVVVYLNHLPCLLLLGGMSLFRKFIYFVLKSVYSISWGDKRTSLICWGGVCQLLWYWQMLWCVFT